VIWLSVSVALLAGLWFWDHRDSAKLYMELLKRMDALQADNRALTEALVRSEGKPLIFRKPEEKDGEGWWDTMQPIAPQVKDNGNS